VLAVLLFCSPAAAPVMMVCGFVLAWQRFYDEDKAIDEEMKQQGL
jgi:hypothetical protein